ncbi:hypothetical protein PIB30_102912 [Stylosanthes scabra]|uniref:DUF4283 domain-containing protein n=1 Tax=Stylosanthes scabra TaxID=79078 RepID=A0ABU6QXB4_9FABA|nr:hypothetical protein [Stylosanthes scabra]
MGVNVEPMDLKMIESRILKEWNGPGQTECRDVGPFRCLMTFDSKEIKEEAMSNPTLLDIFDEVKPHWDFVWSPSRRIWVEIMGISVHIWSYETMAIIAKLWGKLVFLDDRTEQNEEAGRDSVSTIKEIPPEGVVIPVDAAEESSNYLNVGHEPGYEEATDLELEGVKELNAIDEACGVREVGMIHETGNKYVVDPNLACPSMDVFQLDAGWDPTLSMAQSVANKMLIVGLERSHGSYENLDDNKRDQASSDSCPYPPGFGPCTSSSHVHRLIQNNQDLGEEMGGYQGNDGEFESLIVSEDPNKN